MRSAKYHEYAQKGAAATQTWQEAAKLKKDVEEHLARIKTDPLAALKELGIDVDELTEKHVWENIQRKTMTPEQIAAEKEKAELDRLRGVEKTTLEKETAAKQEAMRAHFTKEYDKKIAQAIQAANLPREPRAAKRVVDYLEAAVQGGYEPDIQEIAENVRADMIKETSHFLGEADDDTLMEMLGPKVVEKIRLALLKQFKAKAAPSFNEAKSAPQTERRREPVRKQLANDNWRNNLIKDYMGS